MRGILKAEDLEVHLQCSKILGKMQFEEVFLNYKYITDQPVAGNIFKKCWI